MEQEKQDIITCEDVLSCTPAVVAEPWLPKKTLHFCKFCFEMHILEHGMVLVQISEFSYLDILPRLVS